MREQPNQIGTWSEVARPAGMPPALNMSGRETQSYHASPITRHALRLTLRVSLLISFLSAFAAEVDVSKLPPPATNHVEFARDIKPILERSCQRCHGPERPKGHFSLAVRDAALKGGDSGIAVIPGNSAGSPLLQNFARLVEDMERPSAGKGDPLLPEQIGLLRAWIDQGVAWETNAQAPGVSLAMSPPLGGITVRGDEHKFREHYSVKEGCNGGAENFWLADKFGEESKLTLEGRALLDDDRVLLTREKPEFGFTRFGGEQFRKYYDDTGGYFPGFDPSTFSLGRDLHLDVGRAWADFGLTLPDWPRRFFGYEYNIARVKNPPCNGVSCSNSTRPTACLRPKTFILPPKRLRRMSTFSSSTSTTRSPGCGSRIILAASFTTSARTGKTSG